MCVGVFTSAQNVSILKDKTDRCVTLADVASRNEKVSGILGIFCYELNI